MRNRNHIAIVIDSMHGGGAERVCLELVQYLLDRSYVVDLILCEFSGALLNQIPLGTNLYSVRENNKNEVHEAVCRPILPSSVRWLIPDRTVPWSDFFSYIIPTWPYWPQKIPRRNYYRITRTVAIAKYFSFRTPDLVFAMLPSAYYHVTVGMRINDTKVPLVASIRNSVSRSGGGQGYGIYKKLLRHSNYVHTVSSGIASEIVSLGFRLDGKITSIFNPSCRPGIRDLATQDSGNPWVDGKEKCGHKIVLSIGRLAKQKNFGLLIDAFSEVVSTQSAKLIILGEGSERTNLEKQINRLNLANYIQLPGWMDNPYSYMARCDVFVLSSKYEGLPNVLIEALQCGCNIVATDCPHGPKEILEDGKWGKLIPRNNKTALVNAILEALNAKRARNELVERAMCFTSSELLPKYERLIDHVVRDELRPMTNDD